MGPSIIARNYAETLLELARRSGGDSAIDEFGESLTSVSELLVGDPRLREFLETPRIDTETRKRTVRRAFEGRVPEPFLRFLLVVVDKRRQTLLDEIAHEYTGLVDELRGRARAHVTVAREPDAALRQEIVSALEEIGQASLEFYRALETLYHRSAENRKLLRNRELYAPWVADYFDRGKPKERRDQVLMLDARGIYRKVSRAIVDFSPEQQKNIAAIVWLHRGESERFLALVGSYLAEAIDRGRIREIHEHLLRENGFAGEGADATVYLQITRGCAPRTHAFPQPRCEPTIYAFSSPFKIPGDLRRNGVAAITHPDIRWARCDIKSINLLPNVVAKQRAVEAGVWESVLVRDGVITEGSSTNVFGVIDGELRTYPRSNYILPGVTREVVLRIARDRGIPIQSLTLDRIYQSNLTIASVEARISRININSGCNGFQVVVRLG